MAADNHKPPEAVTEFERQLMQLSPRSNLRRDELMYAAGKKAVARTRWRSSSRIWQVAFVCATAASVVLGGMLQSECDRTRLLRAEIVGLVGAPETDEGPGQSKPVVSPSAPEARKGVVVSYLPSVGQGSRQQRRPSVFDHEFNSRPKYRRRQRTSETVTYWSGRQLLAKANPTSGRYINIRQLVP